MILVTGDLHGDFSRFNKHNKQIAKYDCITDDLTIIVLGDFGLWHDTSEERWKLNWLEEKPFTIVFVDGNHENFDRLYSDEFPIVDFHGAKAHQIRKNLFHILRGEIFELEGKTFFCFWRRQ